MFLFPKRLYRAFIRGRHSLNLYREGFPESELPNKTLQWLRERLRANETAQPAAIGDRIAFAFWCVAGAAYHAAWFAGGAAILWYIVTRG